MANAVTTRSGDNFDYNTEATLLDVNSEVIQRTGLTADSVDVMSVLASELMTGFLNSTSADFDGNSFSVTIQNTSPTFSITMTSGVDAATIVAGTGYTTASGVGTTGGTGTGMLVDIVEVAGAISEVTIVDFGDGLYEEGDTITIEQGVNTTATFEFTGINFTPTASYFLAPEASATFTFFKDTATRMFVMAKNSRTVYGPATAPTDTAIAVFDGTSGQLMSATGVLIDGSNNITGISSIALRDGDGDTITISPPADITGSYILTYPPAAGTTGQYLALDGSGNYQWTTPTLIGAASFNYGTASTFLTISDTAQDVVLAEGGVLVGSDFTIDANGVVTITVAGTYKFSFTVQFESLDQTAGPRASFAARLAGTGTLADPVLGSTVQCYVREQNGSLVRPSVTKIVSLTCDVADTITLQALRTAGTSTGRARLEDCSMAVEKMS